jgi:hypothetical protein
MLPERLPWDFENAAKSINRMNLIDVPVGRSLQIKIVTDSPSSFGTRTTRISAWPLNELWE